jgi:hypothetical protein
MRIAKHTENYSNSHVDGEDRISMKNISILGA